MVRVFEEVIMTQWRKHPNAEALFRPQPITADKLASLIDLGWSDYRIASYFGVEEPKLSGLRAYYGLANRAQTPAVRWGLVSLALYGRALPAAKG